MNKLKKSTSPTSKEQAALALSYTNQRVKPIGDSSNPLQQQARVPDKEATLSISPSMLNRFR